MTLPAILDEPLSDDERARVQANLGLIGFTINRWGRAYTSAAYTADDAYQDGLIGLCTAVRKYDPGRGTTLSTMAIPWIRQAIQRGFGDVEGRSFRSDATNGRDHLNPLSLDSELTASTHDDLALIDVLAGPDDTEADALANLGTATIARLRDQCRTHLERQIFDLTLNTDVPLTNRALAKHTDVSYEIVRRRRKALVHRLARAAGHPLPDTIDHGTKNGYDTHVFIGEKACGPCAAARAAYNRERLAARGLAS